MTGNRSGDDASQTSLRVVEAVADERNLEPTELEPLYGSIDPDGLDSLFPVGREGGDRPGLELSFTFARQRVTISGDGTIDLGPVAEAHSIDRSTSQGSGSTDS